MLFPTSRLLIRPGRLVFAFAAITTLVLWHFYIFSSTQPFQIAEALLGEQTAAGTSNSTLGFQTIIAISSEDTSKPDAWRQRGLHAAATRTGLDVKVHQSRAIPDSELRAFMNQASKSGESPRVGSARAWIAHLDALKHVLAHNITTALILEDDADWDVRIRTLLAPSAPIPSLVRQILDDGSRPSAADNTTSSFNSTEPFSLAYDVLWLGHCGSVKMPYTRQLHQEDDDSLPPALQLRGLADRYAYTPLPDYTRSVMRSPGPTCTYAYAVTRQGAQRILELAGNGGGAAFDNEIGAACSKGEKKGGLRCVSVAPELFHHQRAIGKDGKDSSIVDGMNWADGKESVDNGELKSRKRKGRKQNRKAIKGVTGERRFITFNIMYSARCNAERSDKELVRCMPTEQELEKYTT
ncbi:hypothetical protein MPH_03399 [Macrophomina phaseolina MS6]|uniref:Glycosyl transferase family 25 n=2 Tax=Macrophomina phaseolina TaxID=35725 RepID=K2SS97_MACPH|nr:hypothetical protein MPH_03399 [Macrophomina phaseolina MS6]KAH7054608.1 hypothetical protein B0J12DRAFT_698209 [Macrophomina phaseolina]